MVVGCAELAQMSLGFFDAISAFAISFRNLGILVLSDRYGSLLVYEMPSPLNHHGSFFTRS